MNSLDFRRVPAPKLRKINPKVTIAIGIISKSQHGAMNRPTIFLACDSQTTGPGAAKSLDAQKLRTVEFANAEILVAHAGICDLAESVIEIMQRKAKNTTLESEETVTRVAQKSICEVRDHLIAINKECNFSEDAWKRFFRDENQLVLLLGFYFDRKPYLYTIDNDFCLPIRATKPYKAIGIGGPMGEMFLREKNQADPGFEFGWQISISVIEKVIENMDGCGRPTWVAMTYPMPEVIAKRYETEGRPYKQSYVGFFDRSEIDLLASELKVEEANDAVHQKPKMLELLKRFSAKQLEECQKIVNKEFGIQ